MKETKNIRFMRYVSELRKKGMLSPKEAEEITRSFNKSMNLDEIIERILFLDSGEEKSEWFSAFIEQITNDPVLN